MKGFSPGRGDHAKRVTVARSARRILRKPVEASKERAPARPMLFAQKLLAPGPQLKHPGNVKL
jgi:hypothetical protein